MATKQTTGKAAKTAQEKKTTPVAAPKATVKPAAEKKDLTGNILSANPFRRNLPIRAEKTDYSFRPMRLHTVYPLFPRKTTVHLQTDRPFAAQINRAVRNL